MINQIVLVGRVVNDLQKEYKDEIVLAICRNFKNEEGIYETDFIHIKLDDTISKNVKEYLYKGDLVSIIGRLQNDFDEEKQEETTIIVADKISYLYR